MWLTAGTRMPFYGDPDYRVSVIASVKARFGGAPVDVTVFESWGLFEVYLGSVEDLYELGKLPLVGFVRPSVDRELLSGPRVVV
jgi:hypothetical protein